MMQRLKQFFKAISFRQLLAVCLATILIFSSTACGRTPTKMSSSGNSQSDSKQNLSLYKDTQEGQGTPGVDTKAERLIRDAKRNNQKVQTTEEYLNEVTPDKPIQQQAKEFGESAKQRVEEAGESAKRAAENTAENTQKGFKNLKENTKDMVEQAGNAIN